MFKTLHWIKVYDRFFKITAVFPNTKQGEKEANNYMLTDNCNEGVIKTTKYHIILADMKDKGIPPTKTGMLIYNGYKSLGINSYYFYKCIDCDTVYPEIDGKIKCNGSNITRCPYCKGDN